MNAIFFFVFFGQTLGFKLHFSRFFFIQARQSNNAVYCLCFLEAKHIKDMMPSRWSRLIKSALLQC